MFYSSTSVRGDSFLGCIWREQRLVDRGGVGGVKIQLCPCLRKQRQLTAHLSLFLEQQTAFGFFAWLAPLNRMELGSRIRCLARDRW